MLIIEDAPDGQVNHTWKPVKELHLITNTTLTLPHEVQGRIVQATFTRNCEEERDACESMCLAGLKGRIGAI